ncbi:MAG: AAA family ATPase [Desulfuromonadales bacterium]|nr:AAA family ATPase [Desulfuromonadales bacterium]
MEGEWKYPGSRWWRFDFHVHTPASFICYKRPEATPEEWLKSCMTAGLDCVVVADHNSGDWLVTLKISYEGLTSSKPDWFRPLAIFPGVEITVSTGIGRVHLLAAFDLNSAGEKTITGVLGRCGILNGHGDPDSSTTTSFEETIKIIKEANGIPIAAHVDGPQGLLDGKSALCPELERSLKAIYAAEFCNLNAFDNSTPELRMALNTLAKVGGSDAHTPAEIGKHGTWVKMSTPSIEGLRLALMDHEFCIDNRTVNPNREPDIFIHSLTISKMRHCGRIPGQPFEMIFHPGFNAIIGGRGSGKSTVLDSMRIAARRDGELIDSLSADLRRFKDYATGKGVMENDTEILLGFCRRDEEYRFRWRKDSIGKVFEQLDENGWVEAQSGDDLRERLPLSMYSQKQIYALAENSKGLLDILDRSPEVNRSEWESRWNDTINRFLELRLQQRTIKQKLRNEPELRAKLVEVEKDLKQYEERGHGEILKQYQKRVEQQRAVPLEDDFGGLADRLLVLHEEAQADSFPLHLFAEDDPARLELATIHGKAANALETVQQRLRELATEVDRIAKKRTEELTASQWHQDVVTAMERYETLVREYEGKSSPFDPSLYGHWVQEKTRLFNELTSLEELKREQSRVIEETERTIDSLVGLRRELSSKRNAFITSVLKENPYVQMKLIPFGDVADLETKYRENLSLEDNKFEGSILNGEGGLLRQMSRWREDGQSSENLPDMIRDIKVRTEKIVLNDLTDLPNFIAKPFISRLQKGYEDQPANLDRLWSWWPEDLLRVRHATNVNKSKYEELENGSKGQKASAILAFLLSHGTEPLIIDQPEDDLDNALIYDLVVRQIKTNKLRRQLIIVTHNPNIVVNGDAELVHVLHVKNGQTQVAVPGGLEEQAVRDQICNIMEGGREAFDKRYRRITL